MNTLEHIEPNSLAKKLQVREWVSLCPILKEDPWSPMRACSDVCCSRAVCGIFVRTTYIIEPFCDRLPDQMLWKSEWDKVVEELCWWYTNNTIVATNTADHDQLAGNHLLQVVAWLESPAWSSLQTDTWGPLLLGCKALALRFCKWQVELESQRKILHQNYALKIGCKQKTASNGAVLGLPPSAFWGSKEFSPSCLRTFGACHLL